MTDIKLRLGRSAAVLATIDYRRRQSRDPRIGAAIERFIVERELKELEDEAAAAPPAGLSTQAPAPKRHAVSTVRAGRWLRWR